MSSVDALPNDDSIPAEPKPKGWVQIARILESGKPIGENDKISGVVVEILQEGDEAARVRLENPRSKRSGIIEVFLPKNYTPPFRVGESVVGVWKTNVQGIHVLRSSNVSSIDGRLLIATADSLDTTFAPGWNIELGPVAVAQESDGYSGAADQLWVIMRHLNRTALVKCGEWRRLDAEDGAWLVSALATSRNPMKLLTPDARNEFTYRILALPESDVTRVTESRQTNRSKDEKSAEFAPIASDYVERCAIWSNTWSLFVPYQWKNGESVWALRLNDFPAEPLYTLFIDGHPVGSFSDWPPSWKKPDIVKSLRRQRLVPWAKNIARRGRQ